MIVKELIAIDVDNISAIVGHQADNRAAIKCLVRVGRRQFLAASWQPACKGPSPQAATCRLHEDDRFIITAPGLLSSGRQDYHSGRGY